MATKALTLDSARRRTISTLAAIDFAEERYEKAADLQELAVNLQGHSVTKQGEGLLASYRSKAQAAGSPQ